MCAKAKAEKCDLTISGDMYPDLGKKELNYSPEATRLPHGSSSDTTYRSVVLRTLISSLFVSCCLAAGGAGVNFPSSSISVSPDGLWSVHCVTAPSGAEPIHQLFLIRGKSATGVPIHATPRNCDVLWCSNGQRLAVTDHVGSNVSEIYLVDVSSPGQAQRLEIKNLDKIVPKDELEGHCYLEALRWGNSLHLEIRIFGHTDENPSREFAHHLEVDLVTSIAKPLG